MNADVVAAVAALCNTALLVWNEARKRREKADAEEREMPELEYHGTSKEAIVKILKLMVANPSLTHKEIAQTLHYSEGYVYQTTSYIKQRLGVTKRDF